MSKPTFEQYLETCSNELGFGGAPPKAESMYRINMASAKSTLEQSDELSQIIARLDEMRHRYANGDSALLFYKSDPRSELLFVTKPFQSAISKLYRSNVVFNRDFPANNRRGHIDVVNLYSDIDDLLRTRIICKYMDGPGFVCNELSRLCSDLGIEHTVRDQSTDAGYYAWHFYFSFGAEINLLNDVKPTKMWAEIQISTQLADAISSLTHGLYEERRERIDNPKPRDWKWDAGSTEFRSAYIGHGLHLLEGMIQSFRDDVISHQMSKSSEKILADDGAGQHHENAIKDE